jgi:hypothetical protein
MRGTCDVDGLDADHSDNDAGLNSFAVHCLVIIKLGAPSD